MIIPGRPNSVAYGNQRLVVMQQHEDCVELKTRFEHKGVVLQATALLYPDGEAFMMLGTVCFEDGSTAERFEAEAFLDAKAASKAGIKFCMSVRNTSGRR